MIASSSVKEYLLRYATKVQTFLNCESQACSVLWGDVLLETPQQTRFRCRNGFSEIVLGNGIQDDGGA
jgi:hypothetical protein